MIEAMAKLTALKLKQMSKPGRFGDGGGLWLQVRDAEHRSWLFRYTIHGRARQMGLGPLPDVSLAEAREKARECRGALRDGIDPVERRRDQRAARAAEAGARTFRQVAELYIAAHEKGWRNPKHRAQWRSTLGTYAVPVFGDRPVASVDTADVTRALQCAGR